MPTERFDLVAAGGFDAFALYGMVGAVVVTLVFRVLRALIRRRRVAAVRAPFLAPSPDGAREGAVTLTGTVEGDGNRTPMIAVRIRQKGILRTGNYAGMSWSEAGREVTARPFVLRLNGSGTRVRVLPGEPVLQANLVTHTIEARERLREATLRAGDRARVTGVMTCDLPREKDADGYRGAPLELVLRAQAGEGLLVEAESSADLADQAGILSRRPRLGVPSFDGNLQCGLLFAVPVLLSRGVDLAQASSTVAEVTDVRMCSTTTKSRTSVHECLDARTLSPGAWQGVRFSGGSWSRQDALDAPPRAGDRVLVSFLPTDPSRWNLGTSLLPSGWQTAFSLISLGMLGFMGPLVLLSAALHRKPPWYEVSRLEENE